MKLEKLSDNQIRITLTKEDLESRRIRIGELAYGSDKAKGLFRDMMLEAHRRFGFNADNIPLMIEAIPGRGSSITLLITKVEDPDELDSRFARFAPSRENAPKDEPVLESADDILNLIKRLYEAKTRAASPEENAAEAPEEEPAAKTAAAAPELDYIRLYRFRDVDRVISAAGALGGIYQGVNTLYRQQSGTPYILVLHKSAHTPEEFNRICNTLSEYGSSVSCTPAREAYLAEHAQTVIAEHALQELGTLGM